MRISDWSSDVCSSDLRAHLQFLIYLQLAKGVGVLHLEAIDILRAKPGLLIGLAGGHLGRALIIGGGAHAVGGAAEIGRIARDGVDRSEEHTSELQSLMRISYAVFCLKKKKKMTVK